MIPLFSAALVNEGLDFEAPVKRVLGRHWYILGEEVAAFEREFAAYNGTAHCVTLANGTDALELALRAVGVAAGDSVVAAANAGFYGSTAIHAAGAVPLYADISEKTLTLCPAALRQALALKPKAVIVTHLYGQLAAVEEIVSTCREAGVPLIEDCAQAHGARAGGKVAGGFGDVSCFSFYPTKNLGALGDGGAVCTQDEQLAGRLRTLRQYGWSSKYTVATPGGCNSRLDEMQAAILREKLPRLDAWNAQRRAIARRYNEAFADLPVTLPPSTGEDFAAHLYVLRVRDRDAFRAFLQAEGVASDIHYPVADHLQPAYKNAQVSGSLARTEKACGEVVSLPCFPGLPDGDVASVIAAVRKFFQA